LPNLQSELPTSAVFDQISSYWAEIAQANDTEKQLAFVKNNFGNEGFILDLNCGSGRHTIPLSKAGYDMVGLDISPRLLKIAKLKAAEGDASLALVRADMRFLPFRDDVFSGVVSLDSSFGYLPSEDEDLKSFREVRRTLTEPGVFLVDVFNGDHLLHRRRNFGFRDLFFGLAQFPQFSSLFQWHEYRSFYLLQKRNVIEKGEKMRDVWVFREKKSGKIAIVQHVVRLYQFSLLQTLLTKSSLRVVKTFGGYEGQVFRGDSKRLIIIAAKAKSGKD
jgi:SAM-dependent methyltransferase